MKRLWFLSTGLLAACLLVTGSPTAQEFSFDLPEIPGEGSLFVPLDFPIPGFAGLQPDKSYVVRARGQVTRRTTDLQVSSIGPWKEGWDCWASFIVEAPRGKAATCRFNIQAAEEETPAVFRFERVENKYLRLFEKEKPVLTYNYGMLLKEGAPEDQRRSCYIHPVYGLDGEALTDDFPADHFHHRGLCWVWPRVIVGQNEHDLWSLRGLGQRFEQWLSEEAGPVCAIFGVATGWYAGNEKIVDETVWVRVFRASRKGRAIDVVLTLQAVKQPVTISGRSPVKGYGGFSFRFAPRKETILTSPAGREREDSDLKRHPWADLSARFGGRDTLSGVAIFDDARNPGFPNGWTLRNYGFLGLAWPGLKLHTLKPGNPLTLRYRVWVHRGEAQEGEVAATYAFFGRSKSRTKANRKAR